MARGSLCIEFLGALTYRTSKKALWFDMLVEHMLTERLHSRNGHIALLTWHDPQAMHWIIFPRVNALVREVISKSRIMAKGGPRARIVNTYWRIVISTRLAAVYEEVLDTERDKAGIPGSTGVALGLGTYAPRFVYVRHLYVVAAEQLGAGGGDVLRRLYVVAAELLGEGSGDVLRRLYVVGAKKLEGEGGGGMPSESLLWIATNG
ncbi:hypothetical protein MMC07_000261 [Pseudocyphellaria aurata]|nr:hypothetical protein [Pseudocyphellaria aurata]